MEGRSIAMIILVLLALAAVVFFLNPDNILEKIGINKSSIFKMPTTTTVDEIGIEETTTTVEEVNPDEEIVPEEEIVIEDEI